MANAEARFNNSLRPRKPEGSLGRTAQDGHLDSHTAPDSKLRPFILPKTQQTKQNKKEQKNKNNGRLNLLNALNFVSARQTIRPEVTLCG